MEVQDMVTAIRIVPEIYSLLFVRFESVEEVVGGAVVTAGQDFQLPGASEFEIQYRLRGIRDLLIYTAGNKRVLAMYSDPSLLVCASPCNSEVLVSGSNLELVAGQLRDIPREGIMTIMGHGGLVQIEGIPKDPSREAIGDLVSPGTNIVAVLEGHGFPLVVAKVYRQLYIAPEYKTPG
ncbi:MAG: hypothetical protein ABIG95_06855 [Candidatus Woesearchaeota archaeon]